MNMWDLVDIGLFVFFCISFVVQQWYYIGYFRLVSTYKKTDVGIEFFPASVIICARNEHQNLVEHLPLILSQDFPVFEVVVVNDCSYDDTEDFLKELAKSHSHLKIVTIKEDDYYSHGKKFAQMVGIKGAKYDYLVFTDADCKPVTNSWLKTMMSNFNPQTEIVLGYGAYEKKMGLLNKLIRFDTFYIAMQYLSFSLKNQTYMGVGRNLAYKKSLFFQHKGFASHYHIDSGDDDLFVNEAATGTNTRVEIKKESITISKSKITIKDWVRQKRRHITTGKYYNGLTKFKLGLLLGSQYLFFLLLIFLLILGSKYAIAAAIIFVLRYLIQLLIFKNALEKLNEKDLFLIFPLLELILLFFYPVFLFSNLFARKQNKWKS